VMSENSTQVQRTAAQKAFDFGLTPGEISERCYKKAQQVGGDLWKKMQQVCQREHDLSQICAKDREFLQQLNKEVRHFNSGKDPKTKKAKSVNISPKKSRSTKKPASLKDEIKDILRSEKKRMKYGYTIVPGKVRHVKLSGFGKTKFYM